MPPFHTIQDSSDQNKYRYKEKLNTKFEFKAFISSHAILLYPSGAYGPNLDLKTLDCIMLSSSAEIATCYRTVKFWCFVVVRST
jgi:hypothetical protein